MSTLVFYEYTAIIDQAFHGSDSWSAPVGQLVSGTFLGMPTDTPGFYNIVTDTIDFPFFPAPPPGVDDAARLIVDPDGNIHYTDSLGNNAVQINGTIFTYGVQDDTTTDSICAGTDHCRVVGHITSLVDPPYQPNQQVSEPNVVALTVLALFAAWFINKYYPGHDHETTA